MDRDAQQNSKKDFDAQAKPKLASRLPMARKDSRHLSQLPLVRRAHWVAPLAAAAWLCVAFAPHMLAAQKPHKHHPPMKKQERDQVEDLAEQWRQAQLAGDTVVVDKLLSDDYLGVPASGALLTKSQQLDRMRNRQWTVSQLDVTDMKVKLIGQVAIVTSLARIQAVSDTGPIDGEFRYLQVYQRLPSGIWKITHFEATRVVGRVRQKGESGQQ